MSLESKVLVYPQMQQSLDAIKKTHVSYHVKRPKSLFLLGPSGCGKTVTLKHYQRTVGQDKALYVRVPSAATPKTIAEEILIAQGEKYEASGSARKLMRRAVKIALELKIELVLLDEINHLVDRGGHLTHTHVADALKDWIDLTRIPLVAAGLLRGAVLLRENEQLGGRIKRVCSVQPFRVNTEENCQQLQLYLAQLLAASAFVNKSFFNNADMVEAMFFATDGNRRLISAMLGEAEQLVLAMPEVCRGTVKPELTRELLAVLFEELRWPGHPENGNPFMDGFIGRRLTHPGEPFAPTRQDGDGHDWIVDKRGRIVPCEP